MARLPTSQSTLFMAAWSYTNAMRLMLPSMHLPGNHNLGGPFGLLSGFALELSFKAVLRANGQTDKQLHGLSHNLEAAFSAALAAGLLPSDPSGVRRLVDLMQPVHADHLMRYIPAGVDTIMMPGPQMALDVTVQLLEDIERQVPSIATEMPS